MRKDATSAIIPTGAGAALRPFHAVRSVPSSRLRWIALTALTLFSGFSLAMVLGVAWLWVVEDEEPLVVAVMMLLSFVMLGLSLWLWSYRRYSEITVDDKGITYTNAATEVVYRMYSWQDLQPTPKAGAHDIERITVSGRVNGSRISADFFQWWVPGRPGARPHRETFRGAHTFCYFFSNRHDLMAAFLHGVAHFRPDLKVDPRLFTTFHICPRRFRYNADNHFATSLVVAIGSLFVAGAIAVAVIISSNRLDAL